MEFVRSALLSCRARSKEWYWFTVDFIILSLCVGARFSSTRLPFTFWLLANKASLYFVSTLIKTKRRMLLPIPIIRFPILPHLEFYGYRGITLNVYIRRSSVKIDYLMNLANNENDDVTFSARIHFVVQHFLGAFS